MSGHGNQRHPAGLPVKHLDTLELEQLAEGTLPKEEAAAAQAHVDRCPMCRQEVAAFTNLFSALGGLDRFAPSATFADAVMTRVRVAPVESRVTTWARRVLPRTRRGWALATAALIAPAAPVMVLILWLITQPMVTPSTLWQWSLAQLQVASQAALPWIFQRVADSEVLTWAQSLVDMLLTVPLPALGGFLTFFGVAIPLSAWGLVHLNRTPVGNEHHAN